MMTWLAEFWGYAEALVEPAILRDAPKLAELHAAAVAERANVAALMADSAVGEHTRVQFVPVQRDDVHDLDGLDQLRSLLFS